MQAVGSQTGTGSFAGDVDVRPWGEQARLGWAGKPSEAEIMQLGASRGDAGRRVGARFVGERALNIDVRRGERRGGRS